MNFLGRLITDRVLDRFFEPQNPPHMAMCMPGLSCLLPRGEKIVLRKVQEIARKIFGYKQEFAIHCILPFNIPKVRGDHSWIALHPLFVFTPNELPEKFFRDDFPEIDVENWVTKKFNGQDFEAIQSFSTPWKIYRYLAQHPDQFEGVRDFILANEIAEVCDEQTSLPARFYKDVDVSIIPFWSAIGKGAQVLPFAVIGLGIWVSSMAIIGVGITFLAFVILGNRTEAKVDRRILLRAVKATGDVDSAITYYELINRYSTGRLGWIRRKTIDRIMGYHDPLKTLSAVTVEHKS